jgi:hypothetical protein
MWSLPFLFACAVFVAGEICTAQKRTAPQTAVEWLLGADDRLVVLALLVVAPFVWWLGDRALLPRRFLTGTRERMSALSSGLFASAGESLVRPICCSLFVAGVSLTAGGAVGSRFDDLPPAYHDEYSYLFQAETFLAGRISFPSPAAPRLFDQMHVLNEGSFASRYFPGAGLWMAPFVAAGHPYWGQWLAGAICAVLTFWIGRELAGESAGLIAGLVTALSPGMALFSNLLLAHHPTLVGLGLFVLAALRLLRTSSPAWGALCGAGLAFAMLCRPMTAAGVALPFGVCFLWWVLKGQTTSPPPGRGDLRGARELVNPASDQNSRTGALQPDRQRRCLALAALGLPLLASALGLFFYNRAITGSGWTTPYSLYTDIYTPRHVYGFNNVARGERRLGPRVLENYDKWAENLTPRLAAANALTRWAASWRWTLGIVPLTLALGAGLVVWRQLPREAWLLLAAIISLHAVHIPYWFVGMEDHHYVFEAGPLWGIWTGIVSMIAVREWRALGRSLAGWWWWSTLTAAVVMNFTVSRTRSIQEEAIAPLWSAPLEQGIARVLFARARHGQFHSLVAARAVPLPALVLVEPDPADRHIDYVTNSPDLSGPVLMGHYLPELVPLAEVKRLFPNRTLFLYRVREDRWERLDGSLD